ncbi:hypothetical protein [Pseudomonas sp. S1_E04]
MPDKTPQTAISISRGTAVYDTQDVFFQSPTPRDGQVLREGQTVTYERVRGPGGEWLAINIEVVEESTLN